MKVTESDVKNVAVLSRLAVADDEMAGYTEKLGAIIGYMDILQKADTDGVEPTAHALPLVNVMRDDAERPSIAQDLAMLNAPLAGGGYFKVPKVLEE